MISSMLNLSVMWTYRNIAFWLWGTTAVPFLDRAVIFLSATHIKAVSVAQGHEADNEIKK
jgi:hypothetical protein